MNHKDDKTHKRSKHITQWGPWIFLVTLIFSILYYFHENTAISISQKELMPEDLSAQIQVADLHSANTLYQNRCSACHGNAMQGGRGPNLTDEYWIHGNGNAHDIIKVLNFGILDKGMPAWRTLLEEKELVQLTALILSNQDSNPPGAKAPQGQKVH